MSAVGVAIRSLTGMIAECDTMVLGLMQALGTTPTPWKINSEAGTMSGLLPTNPLFEQLRYDVILEQEWLEQELGVKVDNKSLMRLRRIDDYNSVRLAYEIGHRAAEKQVLAKHFESEVLRGRL
jgi:hypothetical protein